MELTTKTISGTVTMAKPREKIDLSKKTLRILKQYRKEIGETIRIIRERNK